MQEISPRITQQTGRISSLITHIYRHALTNALAAHTFVWVLLFCCLCAQLALALCSGPHCKACCWHQSVSLSAGHCADWPEIQKSPEHRARPGPPFSSAQPLTQRQTFKLYFFDTVLPDLQLEHVALGQLTSVT